MRMSTTRKKTITMRKRVMGSKRGNLRMGSWDKKGAEEMRIKMKGKDKRKDKINERFWVLERKGNEESCVSLYIILLFFIILDSSVLLNF